MTKYRVTNVVGYFGLFVDDEIEAEDEIEARELIMNEIMDNIDNYVDIELEEVDE